MRLRALLIPALACVAVGACAGDGRKGDDTLAVPAAAVDTTPPALQEGGAAVTVGEPGAGTAASGAEKATGVDTPITRKLRTEDSARAAGDTTH